MINFLFHVCLFGMAIYLMDTAQEAALRQARRISLSGSFALPLSAFLLGLAATFAAAAMAMATGVLVMGDVLQFVMTLQ